MTPINTHWKILSTVISFATVCLFFSCKKTDSIYTPAGQPADLGKKVTASVNGFVTNEQNVPVAGASVQ